MKTPPLILIVDDNPMNRDILQTRLAAQGYQTIAAADGEEALAVVRQQQPDLLLLDIMMPKIDGIEVCRRLKADVSLPFMPVIMVTAKADTKDVVAGLEAGGDEYLTKPVDQAALVARVKSMLRIKALQDTVEQQALRLETQAATLAEWNQTLEERVRAQVEEIERLGRLRRFLSPSVAELVASGGEAVLNSHRRQVAALFCDLRGSTAFSENAEPEEAMDVFGAYHQALGELIFQYDGTIDHRAGDGMMVVFNDPLPCEEPARRAVELAVAMREHIAELQVDWRRRGHDLGFAVGISLGYATLGLVGYEGRYDYMANGSVVVLAARLCAEAEAGQIVVSQRVVGVLEDDVEAESLGEFVLKGFPRPVAAFNVRALRRGVAVNAGAAGAAAVEVAEG